MRTDPAISILLGIPFWALLPAASRGDMTQAAALAALAWSILLFIGLLLRRIRGHLPAMVLASLPLALPFLPLPVALNLSAILVIMSAWWSHAGFRYTSSALAAASVPPLMIMSISMLT